LIIHSWYYPVLFLAAFFSGLVDAISGGGGLITLPLMLSLGFPPHYALGTNRLQASFGSFTASYYYVKKDVVNLRACLWGIVFTFIGAAIGTWAVQQISSDALKHIIPFMLVGVIIYSFIKINIEDTDRRARMSEFVFYLLAGLSLGFYGGFFGLGIGSFWAIAFVIGIGYNLKKATGYTKIMNFTSNIVSLFIFMLGGYVLWGIGILMSLGQIAGSKIGAEMVIKREAKFIRPIFIVTVIVTTLKLIYDMIMH
jgi:uncharacterized protein